MSESSHHTRVRVRVQRKKVDENGRKIPHHHHGGYKRSKVLLHKDGYVAPESIVSDTSGAQTVDPLTTNDIDTQDYLMKNNAEIQKPFKQNHYRFSRARTKVNRIHEKNAFKEEDDREFTCLEDDFQSPKIRYDNKFAGKGIYDTQTTESRTTLDTVSSSTNDLFNLPTSTSETPIDPTGAPRSSQTFTSFVGTTLANDQTVITRTNDGESDTLSQLERKLKNVDPFQTYPELEAQMQLLYPNSRRIPTHSFDSAELEDPYEWMYNKEITSIKDQLDVDDADDYANNQNSFKTRGVQQSVLKQNVPRRKRHDSESSSRTNTSEINTTYLQYNPQQTDGLTTVSELVSATQGSAQYIEHENGQVYVEVSADQEVSKPRVRPRRGLTDNESSLQSLSPQPEDKQQSSLMSSSIVEDTSSEHKDDHNHTGMTTVSELVSATAGSAEFKDATNSQEGQLYVEAEFTTTTDQTATTNTTTNNNQSSIPYSYETETTSTAVEITDNTSSYYEEEDEEDIEEEEIISSSTDN